MQVMEDIKEEKDIEPIKVINNIINKLTNMKFYLPVDYNKLKVFEKKLVREQYVEEQDNKCYYCGCELDELPPIEITIKKND